MSEFTERSDDLSGTFQELGEILRGDERGISSGWMHPRVAWAFYWQNGVIKHWVNRMATLMTKAGWSYLNADVPYNWAPVQSDLETLQLKRSMRMATIWAFVFGGAAIYYDVDDNFQSPAAPLNTDNIRSIKKLVPMSAYGLRPTPGKNYATTTHFENWSSSGRERIHRSRLAIVVASEVPHGLGHWGDLGFINTLTGWPPSMLEAVYQSFCDWKGSQRDISTIIKSMSLLSLELDGLRKAAQSPHSTEAEELRLYLEQVAENLENDSLLTVDKGDKLHETGRSVAGLADLELGKKYFFLASTGAPQELVLMQAVGNLGDNSGPIKAFNDNIDGMRGDMLTPVIEKTTELDLAKRQRDALVQGEFLETPSSYTVKWGDIAEQSSKEKAQEREANSKARVNDNKIGVPPEVILGDPDLNDLYPDLSAYREEVKKQQEKAAVATEAQGDKPLPEGELESAAEIARRLGVSSATVLKLREQGKIEGRKIGSRWRFHWASVWEALEQSVEEAEAVEEELEEGLAEPQSDRFDQLVTILDGHEEWTTHNMIAHPLMALLESHGFVEQAEQLHELTLPDEPGVLSSAMAFARWLAGALNLVSPAPRPSSVLGLSSSTSFGSVFGASTAMREIFAVLERVAPSQLSVLITGETGTGKEGIARGIHQASGRRGQFVAMNCAALQSSSALEDVEAAVRDAKDGTLFLDEVGELFPSDQAALLRVLGGGEVEHTRLVSATWQDLSLPCFRRDLLTRISAVQVEVPPLRDREDDVLELARIFYRRYAEAAGWPVLATPFETDALSAMRSYLWPGNVRELKNAVERGALFAGQGVPVSAETMQLPLVTQPLKNRV